MEPKDKECYYLGPARNHLRESKRVLADIADTGQVVITRNVTWPHVPVPSGRFSAPQSKPSEEGKGDETSSEDSGSSKGREESEPGGIEDEMGSFTTDTVTSGMAPLSEARTESGQVGVSYTSEGMVPSGEGLANASAATLREIKKLALNTPRPQGSSLSGGTRAEARKLRDDDQQGA